MFAGFDCPDCFFMGLLETDGLLNNSQTVQQLEENIRTTVRRLEPQILHDVMENALKWESFCEQVKG